MGCLRLTYQEDSEQNFFQGLGKKSDASKNCYKYYPYGMQTANSWTRENTTGNQFLHNGGTELNSTTGVYDLFYRNYDPVLGRMNQVDPLGEKYSSHSLYNYSLNSPTNMNDPRGDMTWGQIFRELGRLWREGGGTWSATGTAVVDPSRYYDESAGGGGSFGGGGGSYSYGAGRGDCFDPGWKPGQGSLSAGSFARQDAMYAQAQGARDTQLGFGLLPGASIDNGQAYYTYWLAHGSYDKNGEAVTMMHAATDLVDLGRDGFLQMYADAGMPIGSQQYYSYSSSTAKGPQDYWKMTADGILNFASISNEAHLYQMTKGGTQIALSSKLAYTTSKSFGTKLGFAGVALTVIDGRLNGWQNHHTADVGIGLALTVAGFIPGINLGVAIVGLAYYAIDLGVQAKTGKSITENLLD